MIKYVVGFAYHDRRVLLCCKKQPAWMDGLWNGLGGKCEPHETPHAAMVREFKEETGVETQDWSHYFNEFGPGYVLHGFRCKLGGSVGWPLRNDRDEPISLTYLSDVPKMPCVGNVGWMVPLGYDWRQFTPINLNTNDDIKVRPTW